MQTHTNESRRFALSVLRTALLSTPLPLETPASQLPSHSTTSPLRSSISGTPASVRLVLDCKHTSQSASTLLGMHIFDTRGSEDRSPSSICKKYNRVSLTQSLCCLGTNTLLQYSQTLAPTTPQTRLLSQSCRTSSTAAQSSNTSSPASGLRTSRLRTASRLTTLLPGMVTALLLGLLTGLASKPENRAWKQVTTLLSI